MWDLELEGLGANPISDTRQFELRFFLWENRLLILPLGASENRSSTPSTRQIKEDGADVSSLPFSRTDLLSSIDCSVAWCFCPCYPPLDVLLLINFALKVWNGQS